jgi:hypothetical protein
MTSLFTRDNTERRKKKKSRTEKKKKKMLRVVRDSLCISLESDTHTHKKRRRKNTRDGKKKKTENFLYLMEGKRELASWAGVCNTADTQRSIYSQNKKM